VPGSSDLITQKADASIQTEREITDDISCLHLSNPTETSHRMRIRKFETKDYQQYLRMPLDQSHGAGRISPDVTNAAINQPVQLADAKTPLPLSAVASDMSKHKKSPFEYMHRTKK
ncbi:hypothetical protein L9F63_024574, partial [Diploptera punctata]